MSKPVAGCGLLVTRHPPPATRYQAPTYLKLQLKLKLVPPFTFTFTFTTFSPPSRQLPSLA